MHYMDHIAESSCLITFLYSPHFKRLPHSFADLRLCKVTAMQQQFLHQFHHA